MKQRRRVPHLYNRRWRSCLGDLSMRRSSPSRNRMIVVQLKLTDAATAVESALPILDELSREIDSLQQRQQINQLHPSAQMTLRFCFCGSELATALVAQAITRAAYQLEELRSERRITDFAVEYEILHSKHSRRQYSDDL